MKTLSQQATQMAAKPKVQWQDFKLMLEQTPAGIAAIAKEMGMSTAEMVQAVQDGKIKTEDFFDAIAKVGNNDTFSKMATEFKTVDQAIDGMKESLANKLMPQFEKLNQIGIKAVVGLTDALERVDINGIADKIGSGLSSLWKGFTNTGALKNIGATFTYISSSIKQLFSKIDGNKLMQGIGSVFGDIANGISQALNVATTSVRSFISSFADTGAFQSFKAAVQDTWNALKTIGSSFGEVLGSSQMQSIIAGIGSALGTLVNWISQVISAISRFISAIPPGILNGITSGILAMVAGFMTAKAGISAVGVALKGLDSLKV
nr:tape measure protein [Streptococcus salivarius]